MSSAQPAADSASRYYSSIRAAWIPMTALCLAFFVEMVDNTLLSIALPTIGRDLGGSTTALQWVTGAYSLTFGGLLLTAGSIADRFGRRRVLTIGLAIFGLLSLAVVWVDSFGQLIALRAALGVAAAMMAPITNSLVFRLFDSESLRRQAMTVMIVVGMSSFIMGPLLGGTALAHVSWQWLLLVNAPVALLGVIGVHLGVPADDPDGLTADALDLPGAVLSVSAIGLACYAATSGVDHGWSSPITLSVALGAVLALGGFIWRERVAAEPMLDLSLFKIGRISGAGIALVGTSVAMAGVLFSLILHFQYAYGWSPVRAGLANLPMILTMIFATPLSEKLVEFQGQRRANGIGGLVMVASLIGLSWAVSHGYPAIAVCMVFFTFGLRVVMTTSGVGLVSAMPENRTSMGAALNDTAQEIGTSIGTALVGTLIAALVTATLPNGIWPAALVDSFFAGERDIFLAVAALVAMFVGWGTFVLTDETTVQVPQEAV